MIDESVLVGGRSASSGDKDCRLLDYITACGGAALMSLPELGWWLQTS